MSAPLPQDRTDLNAMLVRAASGLRAVRCILIARTGLTRHRDGSRQTKSERLSVCSYVVIQTLTLQRSKR
jgi:hypothetical protein